MSKHEINFVQRHKDCDAPTSYRLTEIDDLVVNGKPLSYKTLEAMIGKRFHLCLQKES